MADRRGRLNVNENTLGALTEAIGNHLPQGGRPFDAEREAGHILATTCFSPSGMAKVWDHEEESAKLDELRRASRALAEVYNSIHQGVRDDMEQALKSEIKMHGYRFGDAPTSLTGLIFWVLPTMLEPSITAGEAAAPRGRAVGRTYWLEANLINTCRLVWYEGTGNEAPSGSDLDLASLFGKFVQDVFAVIGAGSPRSAMRAWNRVHS